MMMKLSPLGELVTMVLVAATQYILNLEKRLQSVPPMYL